MKIKVREWKKIKDQFRPEDMHNGVVELWAGVFNVHDSFAIQVDRKKNVFRVNPKDGRSCSFSSWLEIVRIEKYLTEEITEFEWEY